MMQFVLKRLLGHTVGSVPKTNKSTEPTPTLLKGYTKNILAMRFGDLHVKKQLHEK